MEKPDAKELLAYAKKWLSKDIPITPEEEHASSGPFDKNYLEAEKLEKNVLNKVKEGKRVSAKDFLDVLRLKVLGPQPERMFTPPLSEIQEKAVGVLDRFIEGEKINKGFNNNKPPLTDLRFYPEKYLAYEIISLNERKMYENDVLYISAIAHECSHAALRDHRENMTALVKEIESAGHTDEEKARLHYGVNEIAAEAGSIMFLKWSGVCEEPLLSQLGYIKGFRTIISGAMKKGHLLQDPTDRILEASLKGVLRITKYA